MSLAGSAWKALAAACIALVSITAFAQPVWQSSQTAVGTGNATVTKPASTVSGDLLIVGLMIEKGSGETITAPAGWSLILRTNNGSDAGLATYYKVAGGAEPATYTFTIANGSKWSIGISRITGADTSSPIHLSGGLTGASSTSVTAPSITTTVTNTLVLAFYTNKKHATYAPAGGTTERYDVPNVAGGLPSNMMASFVQASAGATGNITATATEAEFWAGQQVAIRSPMPPATKLYLHDAASPNLGTLPGGTSLSTTTPSVTAAGASTNRDMDETIGTAQVSASLSTLASTALQRNWYRRFISRPLATQTLASGVWTIQGAASESAGASDMMVWGAVLKVWRPSTGATVATLLDDPVLGNTEPGGGATNIATATGSIAGVAVNDGDVLVIELWAENTQTSAQARTNTIFYDGTTEGSTSSNAAFLQAPGAITFYRSLRQSAYRLYNNVDSTNVGAPLAAVNTAGALASTGAAFRLRALLHVADINLGAGGQSFKLQYVGKGSGTCAAPSGGTPAAWTDVTAATLIAFNNNATPADGAALTANGNDPTHGTDTVVSQTYEEANNFGNTAAINRGQDGKWDFALRDNGAAASTTYCLRVVKSDGTALDTYFVYPEITTAAAAPSAGGFNAYDTSTAAGAITGSIQTKIAGSTVSLDMIALNAARDAIATAFTGTVRVEVLNAADNSGALDANGCRSSWTLIQTLSPDPAFASGDNGRRTISFTQANSYPNVRLRITYPAGAPAVTGCTNDNFAIRPNALGVAVSDQDWETAGIARVLNDLTLTAPSSGGKVHKAGRPFSIRATAYNAALAPAVTTNYGGAPAATLGTCAGPACSATFGTLTLTTTFAAGQLASDTATYDDVGAFQLRLVDDTFASIDSADTPGDCSGRYVCSAGIDVGRFVPDHLAMTGGAIVPRSDIGSCAGSAFTYLGERMNLSALSLVARNFAGMTTSRYAGSLARFDLSDTTAYNFGAIDSAAPTILTGRITPLPVTVSSAWSNGAATVVAPISVNRNASPDGPYAAVRIGIAPVDADGITLGAFDLDADNNGSNERVQVGANTALRFGRLRLENAVGSQKLDLPIAMQAQYWNGTAFQTNGEDDCTVVQAANVSLANYEGGINVANVSAAHLSGLGAGMVDGRRNFTLLKPSPTPASAGALTLTVDLSAAGMSYLKGNWGVATYTADPSSRAAFGLFGGQPNSFIYFRENF